MKRPNPSHRAAARLCELCASVRGKKRGKGHPGSLLFGVLGDATPRLSFPNRWRFPRRSSHPRQFGGVGQFLLVEMNEFRYALRLSVIGCFHVCAGATVPYFGEILAISSALCWATGVVLFKKSGDHISPVALNLFKNTLAICVFVVPLVLMRTPLIPSLSPRSWLALFLSGVIGISVADTFFFMALKKLGASLTAIVDTTYAPCILIQCYFILGESVGWPLLLGAALIISAMLVGTAGKRQTHHTRQDVIQGMIIGIAGVVLMAGSIVAIKPLLDQLPALWSASFRVCAGTAGLIPIIVLHPQRAQILSVFRPARSWKYAIPASVIGTAMAMLLWIGGMKHTQVSRAALLNQLSTIFIFLLAVFFLKEPLTQRRTVAIVLAFCGAVLVLWSKQWAA